MIFSCFFRCLAFAQRCLQFRSAVKSPDDNVTHELGLSKSKNNHTKKCDFIRNETVLGSRF